jgi:hypothetical protein
MLAAQFKTPEEARRRSISDETTDSTPVDDPARSDLPQSLEVLTDTVDSQRIEVFVDGSYCNVTTPTTTQRIRLPPSPAWAHEFLIDPNTQCIIVHMVPML